MDNLDIFSPEIKPKRVFRFERISSNEFHVIRRFKNVPEKVIKIYKTEKGAKSCVFFWDLHFKQNFKSLTI